jgi:transcriptional regulator with XRE-family HTH domain
VTTSHPGRGLSVAPRRGRPPKLLDPEASRAARLGAELRAHREAQNLTLQALADRIDYSLQHISQVEHGRAAVTQAFLQACEAELGADGALMRLLPEVILEHARIRSARVAARRSADTPSDEEDEVEPINRRGLVVEAGAAAALGLGMTAAPAAAREIDPALPDHWARLLAILGTYDAAHGPHQVLSAARRELRLITEHRQVARGDLRDALMHVEARWSIYASWLCEDTGDQRGRTALLERALHLAREADHRDLIAWARARQAQWSDRRRAICLAEDGMHTPLAGAHTRVLCAVRAAHAYAQVGAGAATDRILAEARRLAAEDSDPPPLSITALLEDHVVRRWEARCWAALEPGTGVALYDDVLREWPRGRTRDGGLYLARLAMACANAGELDRARAEGRKALAIARATKSHVAARELKQLFATLNA